MLDWFLGCIFRKSNLMWILHAMVSTPPFLSQWLLFSCYVHCFVPSCLLKATTTRHITITLATLPKKTAIQSCCDSIFLDHNFSKNLQKKVHHSVSPPTTHFQYNRCSKTFLKTLKNTPFNRLAQIVMVFCFIVCWHNNWKCLSTRMSLPQTRKTRRANWEDTSPTECDSLQ